MQPVTESEAIAMFADLVNPFIQSPPTQAKDVIDAVVEYYKSVRIQGADDSLMLEWGDSTPHSFDQFVDLREHRSVDWDSSKSQWLGLSRQIRLDREDDDTVLVTNLFFEQSESNRASAIEIFGFEEFDEKLNRFLNRPLVVQLIEKQPSRIVAFASAVG